MRIALVTRRYPPCLGGAEKVLSYLANAFADLGDDVSVLTSRLDPALPPVERPRDRLTVVRLPTSRLRFFGTWRYLRNLRRWFAQNPVDLAYVSMLKHDAYAVVGVGAGLGFPVVLRPEGAGATGDVAWQKWGRFGSTIAARCRTADALVAISASVRAELLADGYPSDRVFDLPNGVPIPTIPWTPPIGDGPPSALFVGRLAPEKGLDALIDAWPIVLKSRPGARLVLVGDGPERPYLESRSAGLALLESVEFAGPCSDPETHHRRADLFVLPSREEGMSIALLEVMAIGLPVVASDIPGNRKLLTPGVEGRLVTAGEPESIAEGILKAWSDSGEAQALARAARAKVGREYSIESVARRHRTMFEGLIREKSARNRPDSTCVREDESRVQHK